MHLSGPLTRRRASLSLGLVATMLAMLMAQFGLGASTPTQAAQANISSGAAAPHVVSTSLVISQVYGGGGSTGTATYCTDIVELFNVSLVAQSTSGLSIQYGSAANNLSQVFALPTGTIPAGGYYLVSIGAAGTGTCAALPTPDASTTSFGMAAGSG